MRHFVTCRQHTVSAVHDRLKHTEDCPKEFCFSWNTLHDLQTMWKLLLKWFSKDFQLVVRPRFWCMFDATDVWLHQPRDNKYITLCGSSKRLPSSHPVKSVPVDWKIRFSPKELGFMKPGIFPYFWNEYFCTFEGNFFVIQRSKLRIGLQLCPVEVSRIGGIPIYGCHANCDYNISGVIKIDLADLGTFFRAVVAVRPNSRRHLEIGEISTCRLLMIKSARLRTPFWCSTQRAMRK